MSGLLDRQLLFVSGKGGTGKTSVAAALADLAVRQGKRTLVCEMDAKGALAAAFEVRELTFQPSEVRPGLWAMVMNTEDSLKEYLRLFVRIPLVGRIGPLARIEERLALWRDSPVTTLVLGGVSDPAVMKALADMTT